MKQIILHTARWLSVIALTATPLAAAILTVDNKPGSVAMFNSLQAAYNAAQQDDTIMLAASPTGYGQINVYKRLHFRGPGYLLSQNGIPGTGLAGNEAVASFAFASDNTLGTSAGSTVTGLSVNSGGNNVSVTFDKCNFPAGWTVNGSASSQTIIRRCYASSVTVNSGATIIHDSIIVGTVTLPLSFNNVSGVGTVDRCVFFDIYGSKVGNTVSNSIIANASWSAATFANNYQNSISHCMAVGGSFLPVGNNNINGANLQDVFLAAGSDDARWQLKPASPARGAGLDGVDLGAFGGVQPYILSGLPSKPRLTRFIAPAVATEASGLRIELEAKSY
jgi:hypothetical protein